MSEAKHTPGPWLFDYGTVPPDGPGTYADIYVDGGDTIIAHFNNLIPEGLANARLIAAAPAMLEALQGLTHGLPELLESIGYTDEEGLIDEALAVIAQATGGEDGR